jgi:hypothetical protein
VATFSRTVKALRYASALPGGGLSRRP